VPGADDPELSSGVARLADQATQLLFGRRVRAAVLSRREARPEDQLDERTIQGVGLWRDGREAPDRVPDVDLLVDSAIPPETEGRRRRDDALADLRRDLHRVEDREHLVAPDALQVDELDPLVERECALPGFSELHEARSRLDRALEGHVLGEEPGEILESARALCVEAAIEREDPMVEGWGAGHRAYSSRARVYKSRP
jgi:hypothetical protein